MRNMGADEDIGFRSECWNCEGEGTGVGEDEERLEKWFKEKKEGVKVVFIRVAA
jgi:hypothetical protein